MLSIDGKTITRRLEATLHQHEHTAPIMEYYCARFKWTPSTSQSIDWETFAMAYKPFARTRTFFSKNGWKQLPTGCRLHRWSPAYDHRCPSCNQDSESDDHVYQCIHIHRQQWRRDLSLSIQNTFGSFLDPDLLAIITTGLNAFLHDRPPDFKHRFPPENHTQLNTLINQQTQIGWDHFLRGKLSKEWGPAQYRYAKRFNLVDASKNWLVRLIRMLANAACTVWKIRNGS